MSLRRLFGLEVPMRDGIGLATDVTLPAEGGPFPAILVRSPYSRVNERIVGWADWFAGCGYAFVAQDVRGRGDSGGRFEPWANELDDGYDAIEWLAGQSFCDGAVGMLGGSYEGWVQWAAASRHPRPLKAMVTSGSPGRWFRDWPYRFGAFFAADYLEWLVRTSGRLVQPVPFPDWSFVVHHHDPRRLDTDSGKPLASWQHALDHDTYDDYWHSLDIDGYEQMDIAVLHVTGWFDACAPGELHHFRQMADRSPARGRHRLVIGPCDHHGAVVTGKVVDGDLDIPPTGAMGMEPMWQGWFDRFLKRPAVGGASGKAPATGASVERPGRAADAGAGAGDDVVTPVVRYFCLGANTWSEADDWPPPEAVETVWYLRSDAVLARAPEDHSKPREYTYDPLRPVLSMTRLHHRERLEWQPRPATLVEDRDDVLGYRSAPLERALTLVGTPRVTLHASSSGRDTDFVASIGYVRADGSCTIIADGILRAAMRSSLERAEPLEPGTVYELEIELDDIALHLAAGEALALFVSSSLSPNYHPNPNTGQGYGGTAPPIAVRQRVLHGSPTPSRLVIDALEEAPR
jgi:predicted acyl esterase